MRREDGEAQRGWKPKYTMYVTASRDNVSSYFLCSNDSNRMPMRRKLIRGLGMRENLALEDGVCGRLAKTRR